MRVVMFLLLSAVLFLYSCSPATPAPPPQDVDSGDLPGIQTGIPEIDRIIAAVTGGDAGELRSLVRFTTAPCTTADGLGGPPKCQDGEAEGTPVEVLPFIGSEGNFIRKENIEDWPGVNAADVYAVYRVSDNALNEDYYPAGEYLIVFMPDKNGDTTALRIADGGIVRVDTLYGEFPDSLKTILERDTSEVILPPGLR